MSLWSDLRKRTWRILDASFRRAASWVTIALYIAGIVWADWADLIRRIWLGPLLVGGLVVYLVVAFFRAVAERNLELEERLAALDPDNRAQNEAIANDLDGMLTTANTLSLEILRTYLPAQHPLRIGTWVHNVERYLQQHAPQYLNRFRQPMPLHPRAANLPDGDRARWELSEQIHRVQAIVDQLRDN